MYAYQIMAAWNFQVNRTSGDVVTAVVLFFPVIAPPIGQLPHPFQRDHRMSSYTGVPSLVKIFRSVHEL